MYAFELICATQGSKIVKSSYRIHGLAAWEYDQLIATGKILNLFHSVKIKYV